MKYVTPPPFTDEERLAFFKRDLQSWYDAVAQGKYTEYRAAEYIDWYVTNIRILQEKINADNSNKQAE